MTYVDPQTIHNPATGTSPPASWGDAVRDGLEFLVRPPGCVVTNNANQNSNNGAWTDIVWNAADPRDTDGYHAAGSTAIVIPAGLGGWYNISGLIGWAANATGFRMARYTLNGAGDFRLAHAASVGATNGTNVSFSQDVLLAANDTLRFSAWQNSGGVLAIGLGSVVSVRLVALP